MNAVRHGGTEAWEHAGMQEWTRDCDASTLRYKALTREKRGINDHSRLVENVRDGVMGPWICLKGGLNLVEGVGCFRVHKSRSEENDLSK